MFARARVNTQIGEWIDESMIIYNYINIRYVHIN